MAQTAVQPLTIQDKVELTELLHRYMFVLDNSSDHDNGYGYADLYTEDGRFGIVRPPGREALATAAGRNEDGTSKIGQHRGEENVLHVNVGELFTATAEGAKGISYCLMIDGPANEIYWAGWYEDTYVRTDKGWRFKTRHHLAGAKAGIPSYAPALRREVQKLGMESLEKKGEVPPPATDEIARDPLHWVDEG